MTRPGSRERADRRAGRSRMSNQCPSRVQRAGALWVESRISLTNGDGHDQEVEGFK